MKKILNNTLITDRWFYSKPTLTPNKNGNMVLIHKVSFGPLECWEWGLDSNKIPYEMYKWCENDLYEDENYTKNISFSEFKQKLNNMTDLVKDTKLSDWSEIYQKAIEIAVK